MYFSHTRKLRVLVDSVVGVVKRSLAVTQNRSRSSRMEALERRTLMSTYYVSNSGNDSNSGTSAASAWATVNRANSQALHAGDSLLFAGGNTFNGNLMIGSNDSGSSAAPVTIGSFGNGRATISAPSGRGIYVLNSQYIDIQNLIVLGAGPNSASSYGIKIENNLGNNTTLNHIDMDNVDVSGFSQFGVYVYIDYSGSYFNGISITNSAMHNNAIAGFRSGAVGYYGTENLYIGYCNVYDNEGFGYSSTNVSGSGINVGCVNGGVIERNQIYDNGANGNGGCGVWSFYSTKLLFQYNQAYDNHTDGQKDGDGFDFDVNTSDSVMQFNYAHDNDGNGFQLNNWIDDSDTSGNTIRYNIAQNNGQKNNYAGLEVWGLILNSSIYDNTVYVSPSSTGNPAGIDIENRTIADLYVSNLKFYNNIIVTTGGRPAINISGDELVGATGLTFEGNDYYSSGSAMSLVYGSNTYSSLSSWQSATGQEMLNGKSVGYEEDPGLVADGDGGTISDINALSSSLGGYKLQSSSPLLSRGLNLANVGITVPATDFFGDPLPEGTLDIGAYQHLVSNPQSPPPQPPPSQPAPPAAPWSSGDIGAVGKAGSSSLSGSTFTVSGAGADIFGTADAFQYVSQTLNGDGQIIAEVSGLTATNIWSKAGVMIRNGTGAGAKMVSMLVSANGKAEFERRWGTNGSTGTTDVAASTPEWVKLVRVGNTFTSYLSKDGKTWTEVGKTAVVMNSTVEIGLAVTSHVAGVLATATFNNVSVIS